MFLRYVLYTDEFMITMHILDNKLMLWERMRDRMALFFCSQVTLNPYSETVAALGGENSNQCSLYHVNMTVAV